MEHFLKDGKTRRCGHMVHREVSSFRSVRGQCRRGAVALTDGQAHCHQHNPVVIANREEKRRAEEDVRWLARRKEVNGARFYAVLQRIAEGHNDARGLAAATLRGFDDGG